METLLHIESDLRQQNRIVDKQVASLHGRMKKLQVQQQALEKANKKVNIAKDWETRQREMRAREYERAKAETEAKRIQIRILVEKGENLQKEIRVLQAKMRSLDYNKKTLEAKYFHPSLRETLLNEAERMGPVPQHLVMKTVDDVVPELKEGLREARLIHRRLDDASTLVSLFTSLCVYILGLSVLFVSYRCVRVVRKMLTLPRMLLAVDMGFAVLWSLTVSCYGTILEDPLQVMAIRHAALSVVVQILIMSALLGNVMLRCLLVSSRCRIPSFIELFWAVFLAQHYYLAIWVPFLLDQPFKSTAVSYFGYLLVHISLAVYRARTVGKAAVRKKMPTRNFTGRFESHSEWLKSKIYGTLQYCEDMLATGRAPSKLELEYLIHDSSVEDLRATSRSHQLGLREVYDYVLPYSRKR